MAASWVGVVGIAVLMALQVGGAEAYNFYTDVTITWGGADGHTKILQNGQMLTLSLDKISGGAFQSNAEFLFGRIDMQMKLVPGNSAGTVTTLYLSSLGPTHDEIDFEFLGNLSGDPYTIHTNVYAQGKGDKEMQFKPWFDPTADFHTYSIVWNPLNIIFYVDDTPIRVFKNYENLGLPFPRVQPMRLYSSLWNADDWATQGGRVKTDWTQAPFTATYRNYGQNACLWYGGASHCGDTSWMYQRLSPAEVGRMTYMQQTYMIYNYCTDYKRFPQGLPRECFLPQN